MGKLDDDLAENNQLRILLYGADKTKKTWWAGAAAEAGYNVHILNTDKGISILRNLSPDARKRVNIIDATDTMKDAVGCKLIAAVMKGDEFLWDADRKIMLERATMKGAVNVLRYDVNKLTENDVLVFDSMTALVQSLAFRYCLENKIDISDASKTEWEGYRWAGALLSWMIAQTKAIKAHIIVIGHQEVYSKTKTIISNGKKETVTEWSRTQPKTTSGPHALTIGANFTDILYFFTTGSLFKIDTAGTKDRTGGTRAIKPKVYNWQDLQFLDMITAAGLAPPVDAPLESLFEVKLTQEEIENMQPIKAVNRTAIKANEKKTAVIKTPMFGGPKKKN